MSEANGICDHHAENLILRELLFDLELELEEGTINDCLVQMLIERDEEIDSLREQVKELQVEAGAVAALPPAVRCCWANCLYYNQLEQYVETLSLKELRAAFQEFKTAEAAQAKSGLAANGPNSITYYPKIEATFEGEDVYAAIVKELKRRADKKPRKRIEFREDDGTTVAN